MIPREYIPAVDKGIQETLKAGVLAGYPVVDVKVTLTFGSYHDVDSNENAFRMAGSMAFKEAMRKAKPVLLEPMMAVEVETPEDFMGNVMGDLSSRRGIVQGMEDIAGGGGKLVRAEVPLAEMFGYSTSLRSLTQGRATYTMEFKHYAETPNNVAEADDQLEARSKRCCDRSRVLQRTPAQATVEARSRDGLFSSVPARRTTQAFFDRAKCRTASRRSMQTRQEETHEPGSRTPRTTSRAPDAPSIGANTA